MHIADRWFTVTAIAAGVTLLTEPHVHPTWRSNVWHVRGRERDMLVDAGMGVSSLAGALSPLLDKPLLAVATHRHSDHVGGLHEFPERLAHAADADEIARPSARATLATGGFPAGLIAMLEVAGPVGAYLIDALPAEGYDPDAYSITGAPPTRIIGEGDVVDLGDRAFEVLHLPGHTPGSIGLWEAATGALFSGDAIYDGPLFDFLPESDIPDYLRTMERLRTLPVTAVHGGHEPSFGRERMLAIIDEYVATRSSRL